MGSAVAFVSECHRASKGKYTMKPAMLISSLAVAATLVAGPAAALHINQNAVGDFNPVSAADHDYISYSNSSGVYNTHTSLSKAVTGGLVRNEGASQTVYIFGYFASTTASLTCYIYGRNYDGTLQDSDTISIAAGATGYRFGSVTLTNLTAYANLSAYCILPPSGGARVYAYSVNP
jgi:hypothetical protein